MPFAAQELNFWSGIMRDHGEFQLLSLSSREPQFIMSSQNFKNLFQNIELESEKLIKEPNDEKLNELIKHAMSVLTEFINYKKVLLKKLLECSIELKLTPTFVNHMINEAMEFNRTFTTMNKIPSINVPLENVFLHTIWLPDAAGHAASIIADLDSTETSLIKEAKEFEKTFNNLFIKANELEKMLPRANFDSKALEYLNEEVVEHISNFILYLEKVKQLRESCKALGTLKPLIPDHMIREEKHYIFKIASLYE